MGYTMDLTDHDFTIEADQLPAARKMIVVNYNGENDPDISDYDTVEEELREQGFHCHQTDDGALEIWGFEGKSLDQDEVLALLVPFIKPGSYLEWEGEDSQRWRNDFDGTSMTTRTGRTVWE